MVRTFQNVLSILADALTRSRPAPFVRRIQIILLTITVLTATFLLSYGNLKQQDLDLSPGGPWAEGKNAPASIVASTNIECLRQKQLELARQEAARSAPSYFTRDFSVLSAEPPGEESKSYRPLLAADVENFGKCLQDGGGAPRVRSCIRRKVSRWSSLRDDQIDFISRYIPSRIEAQVVQVVNILFDNYIVLKKAGPERDTTSSTIKVRDINAGSQPVIDTLPVESLITVEQIIFSADLRSRFQDLLSGRMHEVNPVFRDLLLVMSLPYFKSLDCCHFSSEDTEAARREAMSKILPSAYIMKINRGETIIARDEVVTDEKLQALEVHGKAQFRDRLGRVASIFVQQVLMVALLVYFLWKYAWKKVSDLSSNLIVFLTLWGFIGVLFLLGAIWSDNTNFNEVSHFFGAWVPTGVFAVTFSIIFGETVAISLGVYMAMLVFIASKYDGTSFVLALTIALLSSIMGVRIKKRLHFITTGIVLSLVACLLVTAGYLYSHRPILGQFEENTVFSINYRAAIMFAIFSCMSTALVIVLLPVYEALFNIPTRFKLTELADPSSKILQGMFRLAPSTWTHTLMVAAMCEKACERLGLNVLLTRAGVYYHDIGKTKNAGFFIENQHLIPRPENIDRDNPQKAAKVVIDHVLDGLEMAKAARLPREVIAFIPEHHGTSTMAFFYHKALEKMKRKVRREDFRYPGPIPQSKETGIVMIADSVEAASRSLDEVTEHSLDALIHKIISLKLAENQLDESGLTLGDLRVVREAFRDVLLSSFHGRPKYPAKAATDKLEAQSRNHEKKKRS